MWFGSYVGEELEIVYSCQMVLQVLGSGERYYEPGGIYVEEVRIMGFPVELGVLPEGLKLLIYELYDEVDEWTK